MFISQFLGQRALELKRYQIRFSMSRPIWMAWLRINFDFQDIYPWCMAKPTQSFHSLNSFTETRKSPSLFFIYLYRDWFSIPDSQAPVGEQFLVLVNYRCKRKWKSLYFYHTIFPYVMLFSYAKALIVFSVYLTRHRRFYRGNLFLSFHTRTVQFARKIVFLDFITFAKEMRSTP